MRPFLNLLNAIDPNNYSAHAIRGIYYFLIEKNIDKAKYEISQTKNNKDIIYKYNKAFLYAFEGRMSLAEKYYKRAFKPRIDSDSLFQIECFIYDVLENEPNRYQL